MASITDIQAQKRRQGYYNIFIDRKFVCSLSELSVQTFGYHINQQLDSAQIAQLKQLSADGKLKDRCLRYLAIRRRSELEMRQYMRRLKVDVSEVDHIMTWLRQLGYLDDAEFASAWVRDRLATRYRSRRQLVAELAAKGISKDIVQQAIESAELGDEFTIRQLIDKKLRSANVDKQKLQHYLLQRGFSYDLVKSATEDISSYSEQTDTR